MKSVLVPIDFSPASEKALVYAQVLCKEFGAKLTVLHVVEPIPEVTARSAMLVMESDKVVGRSKKHLEEVLHALGLGAGLVEKALVRVGRSYFEITEAARTLKADLIVISTHGRTGLKHVLLGSTAERVVRYAPCPVLVIRPQQREIIQ